MLTKKIRSLFFMVPSIVFFCFQPADAIKSASKETVVPPQQSAASSLSVLAGKEDAQGAKISVDGIPISQVVPASRIPMVAGTHEIKVTKPGFLFQATIVLKPGEDGKIFVFLAPLSQANTGTNKKPESREPSHEKPAPSKAQFGTLHLVTIPEDVQISIDGRQVSPGNKIFELPAGTHQVEITSGIGIEQTARAQVIIEPHQAHSLYLSTAARSASSFGLLKVRRGNAPSGTYFVINGRPYEEAQVLSEQGLKLPTGEVFFVAYKEGTGIMMKTFFLQSTKTEEFDLKLENKGMVSINSQPLEGTISIDKAVIGKTPNYKALDVGEHVVRIEQPGYEPWQNTISIELGKIYPINAILQETKPDDDKTEGKTEGPEALELKKKNAEKLFEDERADSSSFGAVTIAPGHFTVDVGAGWPYIARARISIGAFRPKLSGPLKNIGIDVGAEFRSAGFTENGLGANLRVQLGQLGPIALGTNFYLGGGGGVRGRNNVVFEWGLPITFVAKKRAWVTLRPYFQYYSDRNCQSEDYIKGLVSKIEMAGDKADWQPIKDLANPEHTGDRCVGLGGVTGDPLPSYNPVYALAGISGFDPMSGAPIKVPAYYRNGAGQVRPEFKVEGTPILERFSGIRVFLQFAAEVTIYKSIGMYGYLEFAPGQGERQALTDKFNRVAPMIDATQNELGPVYGGLGITIRN